MTKFNPDFWEVTIASESWSKFSEEDGLWHQAPEDRALRDRKADRAKAARPKLMELINNELSGRQRDVVILYFFDELNQREIAERLGISQQSVSEHLYGKTRDGHTVGGAIRRLHKLCSERGIHWN